ncbi:unnamed protein product [Cuscuta europaea]|uniref:Uncharacterized protein n=1 Tax=Cuscuta europaea TaxID=41803 RepID=A0A9P1E8K3_CUSEU|nr:unnamed protein product [Cuscuta europaea]
MGSAKETKKKKKGGRSLWYIFKLQADGVDLLLMSLGFFGAIGNGISAPIMYVFTGRIMNNLGGASPSTSGGGGRGGGFSHHVNQNVLNFCYLACWQWVACFLEGYCWTRTAERQASRLRMRYMKAVLRQDVGYFDSHVSSTADVIDIISVDIMAIQDLISEKIPTLLTNLALFVSSYVVGFMMLWRLAIVGVPFIAFLVIPGLISGRALTGIARKMRAEYSKAGRIVEQAISSIRTVYSFAGEEKTVANYSAALERAVKIGLRQGLVKGLAVGSNGIVFAMWGFMAYYGSNLVIYHAARGGTVFAVGSSIARGGKALGPVFSEIKYLSEATISLERIMEVIKRVPSIDSESKEGQTLENVCGELEFRNVDFAYPTRPESKILKDFSLRIPAGKKVALVGGSGSGKSTVVGLLQRFYDPINGEILLDGVCINKIQVKWLRSQMGLVSQEPALFATTIKENILFGKESASMEEVIQAAKASNAHNFISQFPLDYDTQVGERGVQMSGGQKQRIAIARSIIKTPRILLLDEATSALDSGSEQLVQEALDEASIGRTTIIIAHRLSTIKNVDLIAVVQNGHIKEIGSHKCLIEDEDGIYSSLIHLQHTASAHETSKMVTLDVVTNSHAESISVKNRSNLTPKELLREEDYTTHLKGVDRTYLSDVGDHGVKKKDVFHKPSFKRLLSMNSPEWKQATLGSIGAILFGGVQPLHAFVLGSMVSVYFLPNHDEIQRKIKVYALCFLGLAVFSFFINILQHYNFAVMGEYLTKRVRERVLSKLLTFEIAWYDKDANATGSICSRLSKDANVVRSLVGDRMALLIQAASTILIAWTMGLIITWQLGLVMVAVQPLIISCYYCKRVMLKSMSKKANKAQQESSKLAAEAITNMRTITAFSSQSRILDMLKKSQESPKKENIRQSWIAGIALGASNSLMTFTRALGYWYGGKLVAEGATGAKSVFQTFQILLTTGRVIADAGTRTNDLAKGSDAVGSVFAILDRHSMIEPKDYNDNEVLFGHIEFQNVYFAYPARPNIVIFNSFSITFDAGKSTALVGSSGSGKSTIISLIERFYDPIDGAVRIDGRDVKSYDLRTLRKNHIALVSQEPTLFAGTIRDNILYGAAGEANEVEIIEAAKAANAHDFISSLEDGYDTWCGDRGLQLSGGQKQRIAIARALLKNPKILLLDEATSALDSHSEKLVQDALERLMMVGSRTSVLVAHRLSTIQHCDSIVVLDDGNVVEKGTHSSLLAKGPSGTYFSLVNLQSNATQLNSSNEE